MTTPIGRFPVAATADEVAAFRAATRLAGDDDTLPLTYPIRWLVTPEIRAALLTLVPEPDLVLVHESQSFDYKRSLRLNEPYMLALTARRAVDPDRLFVDGTIADTAGTVCATVETILRLFSTKAAAA